MDVWTATHTRRLGAVQRRALRLLGEEVEIPASITSLQHRGDLSSLTVCHKAQVLRTPHPTQRSLIQPTGRRDKHKQDIYVWLYLSPTVRITNERIKPEQRDCKMASRRPRLM